jgi:hypothetical protein
MTASIPPSVHEEIDFLDEIERELVQLTTAQLEEMRNVEQVMSLPLSTTLQTVIPAQAGTHTTRAFTADSEGAVTPPGDGSSPSRG